MFAYHKMGVHITTYANKSHGLFEALVHNEFGVHVEVLGWGTEWRGFTDKFEGVLAYLDTRKDEDIVVFLDGFDTMINRDPAEDLERLFTQRGCKVLLSREPKMTQDVMGHVVFGACKDGVTANTGMYMGYAKELREVLTHAMRLTCKDDQVNMNTVCKSYDFIEVDTDERIFKNVSPLERRETDAIFVSFPGSFSFKRMFRGIFEYAQFVYIHVLSLIIVGLVLFPSRTHILLPALLGFSGFYAFFADTSCTVT